jgi:hypothetical protein
VSVPRCLCDGQRYPALVVEINPGVREALGMLHADLEASELGPYQFHLVDTGGTHSGDRVYAAALPDGSFDVSSARFVDYDHLTEIKDLVLSIAGSAQDALFEIEGIIWAPLHRASRPASDPEPSPDGRPVWWCDGMGGHTVALIGQLGD